MLTTHVYFQPDKEEIAKFYVGELCDILNYYATQRKIVIASYLIALFLKQYNMYYMVYLEIHIYAKQKVMKIQDAIKRKYYIFFTEVLRDSENTFSYFQKDRPYFSHIITSNYLLILMLCLMLGFDHRDNQLINMAVICTLDVVVELFDLVPNWRRRQLLILDELIQIVYSKKDLWYI